MYFFRSAIVIMLRTPTLHQLREIDALVGQIRSRQLMLSAFGPDNELSANRRREKEMQKHTLQSMINYLRVLVQDFDIIPHSAAAILNSA
ncbi:GfV-B48-ORF1 [Ichnoviriform fumiferanae]|uniref:GfV-B48-ORF1 n=1 Tax=Ichnoviriform fumiferanae TaxID=419435 RepID=A2PZU5_9VIRU|nr:GfV-B48-ORF1 [Ichnoviriform fumiferanae]BAF45517.1 GfV-B48-ORF1 [Ichnoviriform fumiferanae]